MRLEPNRIIRKPKRDPAGSVEVVLTEAIVAERDPVAVELETIQFDNEGLSEIAASLRILGLETRKGRREALILLLGLSESPRALGDLKRVSDIALTLVEAYQVMEGDNVLA